VSSATPGEAYRISDETLKESVVLDRRMGIISLLMWLGTAVRVYPLLSLWENLQSVSAMVVSTLQAA
jgi:hypothetical protein